MSNRPIASLLPQTNIQFYSWARALGYSADDLSYFAEVYVLAQKLFACSFRACGKPFTAHLLGTAAAVGLERPPAWVVGYALCHLAIENGQYRFGHSISARREQFASVVGPEAIALDKAYKLAQLRPKDSLAAVLSTTANSSICERYALMVWLANELEEYLDNGRSFSAKKICEENSEEFLLEVARVCAWNHLEQLAVDIFDQLDRSGWMTPLVSDRSSAYTQNELTGSFPIATRFRWKLKSIRQFLGLARS